MSTTVVASRHGLSLYLLPLAGRALDASALRAVLARHDLALLEGTDLRRGHELIAAQGLEPAAAAALADDLRAAGFTARVVNTVALTRSARVGNAMAGQMFLAMAGLVSILLATQIAQGNDAATWAVAFPLLGGGALILLAIINGITLNLRGGLGLRVAGVRDAPTPLKMLTDKLGGLEENLPEHLAAPLRARAHALVEYARLDPDGAAAAELEALVEDLRQDVDARAAEDARDLRDEIARARRAVAETRER